MTNRNPFAFKGDRRKAVPTANPRAKQAKTTKPSLELKSGFSTQSGSSNAQASGSSQPLAASDPAPTMGHVMPPTPTQDASPSSSPRKHKGDKYESSAPIPSSSPSKPPPVKNPTVRWSWKIKKVPDLPASAFLVRPTTPSSRGSSQMDVDSLPSKSSTSLASNSDHVMAEPPSPSALVEVVPKPSSTAQDTLPANPAVLEQEEDFSEFLKSLDDELTERGARVEGRRAFDAARRSGAAFPIPSGCDSADELVNPAVAATQLLEIHDLSNDLIAREGVFSPTELYPAKKAKESNAEFFKNWKYVSDRKGDIRVDENPKARGDDDYIKWLDPKVAPADRLNSSYADTVPLAALMVVLGPTSPPTTNTLLPAGVQEAILFVKSCSVVEETTKSYAGIVKNWISYCDEVHLPSDKRFPADPSSVLAYLTLRKNINTGAEVQADTVAKDLSALQFWHRLHGVPLNLDTPQWKMLYKGLKNLQPPPNPKRNALSILELVAIYEGLDFDDAGDMAIWAATLAGFFGIMRSGEFVVATQNKFGPRNVLRKHATFVTATKDVPEHFSIHLPWDKTHKAAGRDVGVIGQSPADNIDPLAALKAHLEVNDPPADASLFSFRPKKGGPHIHLTKSCWRNRINACLSAAGLASISGHEVRIGGCTFYIKLGMKAEIVQKFGGWSSDVWFAYWRDVVAIAAKELKCIEEKALSQKLAGVTLDRVYDADDEL